MSRGNLKAGGRVLCRVLTSRLPVATTGNGCEKPNTGPTHMSTCTTHLRKADSSRVERDPLLCALTNLEDILIPMEAAALALFKLACHEAVAFDRKPDDAWLGAQWLAEQIYAMATRACEQHAAVHEAAHEALRRRAAS